MENPFGSPKGHDWTRVPKKSNQAMTTKAAGDGDLSTGRKQAKSNDEQFECPTGAAMRFSPRSEAEHGNISYSFGKSEFTPTQRSSIAPK